MPVISQEQAQQLAQIQAQNQQILASTQWQWARFANSLTSSNSPAYALGTLYRFNLANTSGFLRGIRIWLEGVTFANSSTTAAGALNRNGFAQLLGSLEVKLGNAIYRVQGGLIPLLWQTYSSRGDPMMYRGSQFYDYSLDLSDTPTSIAASGTGAYTGYVDIPFAVLEKVYDPTGMAPTLANTGMEVEFTTPGTLQGADCLISPFGAAGTLALSGTAPGTISVYGSMARQVSVVANGSLPPFVVSSAFVYQDVPQAFVSQESSFYPFQGQDSALILVKSIVVIDNPGDITGEYSDPAKIVRMDLMYDAQTPVYQSTNAQNPFFGASGGLSNWMVDQGKAIGDQPPGVYVFDFGRGTDAFYPNSNKYFNLEQFTKGGIQLEYSQAPNAGARIHFCNQYLVPDFYKALKG